MSDPAVAFGFKRSTKAQKVDVNIAEDVQQKVALSAVERGGIFRTTDGQDASHAGKAAKKEFLIPMQNNTYKAGTAAHKFTPTFLPPSNDAPVGGGQGEDRFESAAPAAAPSVPQTYGLQHVQRREKTEDDDGGRAGLGGSITERLTAAKEEQAYQKQVEELPDMANVEVGAGLGCQGPC